MRSKVWDNDWNPRGLIAIEGIDKLDETKAVKQRMFQLIEKATVRKGMGHVRLILSSKENIEKTASKFTEDYPNRTELLTRLKKFHQI